MKFQEFTLKNNNIVVDGRNAEYKKDQNMIILSEKMKLPLIGRFLFETKGYCGYIFPQQEYVLLLEDKLKKVSK